MLALAVPPKSYDLLRRKNKLALNRHLSLLKKKLMGHINCQWDNSQTKYSEAGDLGRAF
jgi:hypothetical protein